MNLYLKDNQLTSANDSFVGTSPIEMKYGDTDQHGIGHKSQTAYGPFPSSMEALLTSKVHSTNVTPFPTINDIPHSTLNIDKLKVTNRSFLILRKI